MYKKQIEILKVKEESTENYARYEDHKYQVEGYGKFGGIQG